MTDAGQEARVLELNAVASHVQPYIEQVLEGLPPFLQCSSITLVAQALHQATTVAVSQRIMDETLALATAGVDHLADNLHNPSMPTDFQALVAQREASQAKLETRASRIQTKWLNARFRTVSLLPELKLSAFTLRDPDAVDGPSTPLDSKMLEKELAAYNAQLEIRVSQSRDHQRRVAAETLQLQQADLARRKRQLHVKQTRFELAQHRWEYLSQHLVRRQRQHRMSVVKAAHIGQEYAHDDTDDFQSALALFGGHVKRRSIHLPRDLIDDYVSNILDHAVSRAAWMLEMQALPQRPVFSLQKRPHSSAPHEHHVIVLHVAMLLCPNPFGSHFGLMYQRFFAKHAADAKVVFEWTIFDVASLDFPTQAMQRCFDGFFICGAPDVAHATTDHIAHRSAPWYSALVDFVRALVAQDRPVGALGRGHVILAEALGGRVVRRSTWQRAHNVLEEKVTTGQKQMQTRVRVLDTLHGEYVASMTHPTVRAVTSVPVPGSMYSFVSCIKAKHILSFDGYPECSGLVFNLLSRVFDPQHGTSEALFKKVPAGGSGSIALAWVGAGQLVADQFIQLFIPGAVARSKGGRPHTLIHDDRGVPMAIFAMKSSVPHIDFISDTEEYVSFAINEHVDSIVLGLNLSKDDHPIVFPRSCLNEMTDIVDVFPSLFFSPKHKKHHHVPNQHGIAQVHIPRLTLLELKSLTILHAYQSRHVMKSPRLIPGSSSGSHNRLLTLCSALKRIADIQDRQRLAPPPAAMSASSKSPPLHVTILFPDEDSPSFVNYSPPDIQRWWRVLNGAIAALNQPTLLTKLTIVSRDATLLQVLRKMQPAWDYVFVVPVATTFQDAVDVRRHAKIFARFADGVMLSKDHEFIACPPAVAHRIGQLDLVSVVDVYHEVGLRVFVNANSPENVATTILGPASGPVREQLAFLLLGVDGVFTSNPHPVQDARKLFADRHSVADEVREAINAHCRIAMEKMEADHSAESERLSNEDGYRLYAHHYYNLPLESHEFDRWQQRHPPPPSHHASLLLPLDTVLDHIDRLHAVNVAAEAQRQLQSLAPVILDKSDNQRRDLPMAVKSPTLDQVRRVKREKPLKMGKRNRSVGFAFRSRHLVLNDDDDANWKSLAVHHIPTPPPKPPISGRQPNPGLHNQVTKQRHHVTPMPSLETRTPSMALSDTATPPTRRRRILHSINLPVCSI